MKRSPLPPRRAPIPRSSRPAVRTQVKKINRARKTSEFARCYHSHARVEWVKTLPCVVPGCEDWPFTGCDNMHIEGGGAGRKAGYKTIVPCCRAHHLVAHAIGVRSFEYHYALSLTAEAARIERAWQEMNAA